MEKEEFRTRIDGEKVAMDIVKVIGIAKPNAVLISLEDGYTPVDYKELNKKNGKDQPFSYPFLKKARLIAHHLGYRLDKQYRDNIEILKPKKPKPLIIRLNKNTPDEVVILVAPSINEIKKEE